jgi:F0F1-type ATP synthase epsilon subunit
MFNLAVKRAYSLTAKRLAEPVASSNTSLIINFCTPHAPVYNKKVVNMVILPGESGEYGVTVGHSPLISLLKPGVVSVIHTGVTKIDYVSIENLEILKTEFISTNLIG